MLWQLQLCRRKPGFQLQPRHCHVGRRGEVSGPSAPLTAPSLWNVGKMRRAPESNVLVTFWLRVNPQ